MKKTLLICIFNVFIVKAQQINPFYLGHSLINFDMPAMVDGLAASANKISNYNQQIINGAPLAFNYNQHATAQGMSFQTAFPGGGFNNFVITECVPLQNNLSFNDTFGYANTFFNYANNNNNGLLNNF